jgi:hypothetical protein
MLRITPMPSIFGLVKESYQMTTTAKVAIGLTLAEKILGYMSERQQQSAAPAPVQSHSDVVANAISNLMRQIDNVPGLRAKYENLNQAEKMELIRQQLALKGIQL